MTEIDNEINSHFNILRQYVEHLMLEVARGDSVPEVSIGILYNLQGSISTLETFIQNQMKAETYPLKQCA